MVTMADAPAPAFGKARPKNQRLLLIGGLGAGGVVGYIWYERRKANAANTTGISSTGIDPNTGVPYSQESIDPNTGVPYASEQSYGGLGVTPGALGTYNPLTGQYIPGLGSTIPTASIPASNAQWAAAAETALTGYGYDPLAVATALGLYLGGQPLSQDQYQIVQAALAFEGNPPTTPPTPSTLGGNGGPGIGGGGGGRPPSRFGTVTVPNVVGENNAAAFATLTAVGLLVRSNHGGGAISATNRQYKVVSQTPGPGTKVPVGTFVDLGVN